MFGYSTRVPKHITYRHGDIPKESSCRTSEGEFLFRIFGCQSNGYGSSVTSPARNVSPLKNKGLLRETNGWFGFMRVGWLAIIWILWFFSRMRSEGFLFISGGLGVGLCLPTVGQRLRSRYIYLGLLSSSCFGIRTQIQLSLCAKTCRREVEDRRNVSSQPTNIALTQFDDIDMMKYDWKKSG